MHNASIDTQSMNESAAGNHLRQMQNNRAKGAGTNADDEQLQNACLAAAEHEKVIEKRKLCKCSLLLILVRK